MLKSKKPLIIFAFALATSIGLSFLSLLVTYIRASLFSNAPYDESAYFFQSAIGVAFGIIDVALIFSAFYFLSKKGKIKVLKTTSLSLFLGLLVGGLIWLMGSLVSVQASYVWVAYTFLLGLFTTNFFYQFLPAISALLFAELRERNSVNPISPSAEATVS